MKANIGLHGCDDSTEFDLEVTEDQFNFLNYVAAVANEIADHGCMPTMSVQA